MQLNSLLHIRLIFEISQHSKENKFTENIFINIMHSYVHKSIAVFLVTTRNLKRDYAANATLEITRNDDQGNISIATFYSNKSSRDPFHYNHMHQYTPIGFNLSPE